LSQLLRLIRARRAREEASIPGFIIDPEKIPDGDVDAEIARIEATLPEYSKNWFPRAIFRVLVDPEREAQ
jgi:hypothetical protein